METETENLIHGITTAYAGRSMAERVFCQVVKAKGLSSSHVRCLTDRELAAYLAGEGWTWRDVVKRES